jgi:hypothetical protein
MRRRSVEDGNCQPGTVPPRSKYAAHERNSCATLFLPNSVTATFMVTATPSKLSFAFICLSSQFRRCNGIPLTSRSRIGRWRSVDPHLLTSKLEQRPSLEESTRDSLACGDSVNCSRCLWMAAENRDDIGSIVGTGGRCPSAVTHLAHNRNRETPGVTSTISAVMLSKREPNMSIWEMIGKDSSATIRHRGYERNHR